MNNKKLFNYLYSEVDTCSLSWTARNNTTEEESENLIYGEFELSHLEKIYKRRRIKNIIQKSNIFYDLGSGAGKIIISTALLFSNFQKLIGIEILKELYEFSNEIKDKIKKFDEKLSNKIEFIKDSFFNIDISDADVIFLHFPIKNNEDAYLKLEEKFRKELKQNTLIIAGIRTFSDKKNFILVDKFSVKSGYGKTSIFCYLKQ